MAVIFYAMAFCVGWLSLPSTNGHSSKFNYAEFIVKHLDKNRIRAHLRDYSSQPRLAGTPLNHQLALQLEREWRENGLDEVHLATYDALLSYPNSSDPNKVQIINKFTDQVIFESHLYEVPLREGENNSNVVPPFNSYAPAGIVTGKMVYVNYGREEDFQLLQSLNINVSGCIVIARYGKIYRGDKAKIAHRNGATAVILYSDPADVTLGGDVNNTYPHSSWLPPSGIERGTVCDDGATDTPLYPATYYAHKLSADKVRELFPKIPIQSIGYNDAKKFMESLAGPVVPEDWQGLLLSEYRLGPQFTDDSIAVRVTVNNYNEVRPIYNVIGYIKGHEEPDRYVLMGNHHDTWAFGAMDPLSGTAAITELTRVFGLMLKAGHRPKRTIVFCSWDGEEYDLFGSTDWVEDNLKLLLQRAVAYLNLDYPALSNYTLAVGTSPLLQDALYLAAKKVPSSERSKYETLYDLWLARSTAENPPEPDVMYSLGSSSDMAAFYQRAGVPCVDMWYTYNESDPEANDYPLYHTLYDTDFAFENFVDPGFWATAAITQLMGVMACDLAWLPIFPMRVTRYSAAISSFYDSLVTQFEERWRAEGVNLDAFYSAVKNFSKATEAFQNYLDINAKKIEKSPLAARRVNDLLMLLERAFLDPEGLPGRPAMKHVVFAPSLFDAYVDNAFPGIVDTMVEIERGDDDKWELLKQQLYIATYIVQGAARWLQDDVGL